MAGPDAPVNLAALPANESIKQIRNGHLKLSDLCEATLERTQARSDIGAWTFLDADLIREQARALDAVPVDERTSPLFGVTVGIKDIIYTRDMPTRHGSERYANSEVYFDASVVQILRRAGCVIFGKTVSTEMAFTMNGKHTVNPRNTKLSPGGSSSGSAAAVADEQVQISVGTQTFGSITRPASYCGIFGWKPTFGLISTVGGKFCSPTLDTIGFFARNTEDLKLVAQTFQAEKNEPIAQRTEDWQVGIMIPLDWDAASEDAKNVLSECEGILKTAGAKTQTFELPPSFKDVLVHQRMVATRELAGSWLTEGDIQESDDVMIRNFYEEGKNVPYTKYYEALDSLANRRREFDDIAAKYTCIISLSATGEAPSGLKYTGDSRFNAMSTALHFPVVNVPGLVSKAGNPIGISVMAGRGHDLQVLEASATLAALFRKA